MRVLFVTAPLVGHLAPVLPLAGALRAAGHEVLLATGGDALALDTGGLPVRDAAAGLAFGRIAGTLVVTSPVLAVRELSGRAGTGMVGRLFGAVGARMADAVVATAREWHPDLVVQESLAPAGTLAAAALGVPAVLQESNLFDGLSLLAATWRSAPLRRAARRHGVTGVRPAEVLTVAPPSLVGPRTGRPMRSVRDAVTGELPDWLTGPRERPLVLVSHSTISGPGGGDPTPGVLAAAAAVDADFVLVRGRPDRPVPPNVRVTGWLPLAAALRHADGFVHHGGAGGLLEALAAGVPQLAEPGAGDRRFNAELVERRGVGLAVPGRRITPAVLTRLVTDGALRRAAAEVRDEMAAMPVPSTLIPSLEALAGR